MEALEEAAEELRALCSHSFGPCAQETLLFAPPSAPVITSDGHAVLMAWRSARRGAEHQGDQDAMAAFLLDAAHGVHTQLGDGTSTFVLTVHAAVKACSMSCNGEGSGVLSQQQLAAAFGQLKQRWRSPVHGFAAQHTALRIRTHIEIDSVTRLPTKEFHAAIANVLQTALRSMLHHRIVAFLVDIVIEWIFRTEAFQPTEDPTEQLLTTSCGLWERVQCVLKHTPDRILFALSASIDDSRVLPPGDFIIERSLVSSQPPSLLLGADTAVRFVCFTCELSMLPSGANHVSIVQPKTVNAGERGVCATAQYLRTLREELNVRLLICSWAVEESVVSICTQLEIACVQLAEDTDLDQLCIIAGISPLASVFDEISDSQHVGVASEGVARVRLNQTACLHFHGLQRNSSKQQQHGIVPQVALKAPSKGVYKQLCAALYKALRVLASWWEPTETNEPEENLQNEVYCCRGAGVSEEAVVRWLQDDSHWSSSLDSGLAFVRYVMADALIEVIVLLRSNLNGSSSLGNANASRRTRRRELLDRLTRATADQKAAKHHAKALVLDLQHVIPTLAGLIRVPMLVEADPLQYGVVHPWSRIDSLVVLVLETLERAFRIDRIVRVKRLPKDQEDSDNL